MSAVLRSIRRLVRRAIARAGAVLLGGGRWEGGAPLQHVDPDRILVIRVDERVGNVLLTTPLLRAVREAFPAARVDVLVAASKRALVEGLAHVISFERRALFMRPCAFMRILLRLRRERYDVAIDASHWHQFSVSSAMLLAWSGAPIRIAHDRGDARLFATHLVPPSVSGDLHEIAAKMRLLEPLGVVRADPRMSTSLGGQGEARERMVRWLEGSGVGERTLVGVAPGARKRDHRLPVSIFGDIASWARALGACPIVLWGPGEERLAAEVAGLSGALIAPRTNLEELAALIRSCAAVITNDTGPMHLAVACGAPTVALFAHADHRRWGHDHAPHVVVLARDRPREEIVLACRAALSRILGVE